MDTSTITKGELLSLCIRLCIGAVASYFSMKILISAMDPNDKKNKLAKNKAQYIFQKLGIKTKSQMTEHELIIASQVVMPADLNTSFKDVAGLAEKINDLNETLIWPVLQYKAGNQSKLLQPPKGILLHGPPGCGKTLLARAIASEAGATFINLDISSLTDKWYGESQKLSSAVFTLAGKIQPCIIFIDEIDSFLRVRDSSDHEATAMMKAQFLQQWDGLGTVNSNCIIVMGATNRPNDVDVAILRRMPSSFHIQLPGLQQRLEILKLILNGENIQADLNDYAAKTDGFSGSDLKELCRSSSVNRLTCFYKRTIEANAMSGNVPVVECINVEENIGPITKENLDTALFKMRSSRVNSLYERPLD